MLINIVLHRQMVQFASYHNKAMSLYNSIGCEEVGSDWDAVKLFIPAPPHNTLSRTGYIQLQLGY